MRHALTAIIISLSVTIAGCETRPALESGGAQQELPRTDQETASLLVGVWYGKYDRDPGEVVEFITTHNSDQTFTVNFRTTDSDGSVIDHREKGTWRVRGDIISKRTTEVEEYGMLPFLDADDPFYNDDYKIISLTQTTLTYEHILMGIVYTSERVADDFEFPPMDKATIASEPQVTRQSPPSELSEEARIYFKKSGRIFIDRFDQVCSATKLELSAIAFAAESLGWSAGQTRPSETNIRRWTSFTPFDENSNNQPDPPLILDVALSTSTEREVLSCSLTMWGTSSQPDIGKQEIELIARDLLPPQYQMGDIDHQTVKERSPFFSETIEYTTYGADITKLDDSDLRYLYRWLGGTHTLGTIRKPE